MEYQLTPDWQISLPNAFQHRKEGQHMVFWTTGCTLLTTVFGYTDAWQRQILLDTLREKAQNSKLNTIEEQGEFVHRFGYLQPEIIDGDQHRLALHAFSIAETGCLQTSFYLDRPEDLQIILEVWQSVTYTRELDD